MASFASISRESIEKSSPAIAHLAQPPPTVSPGHFWPLFALQQLAGAGELLELRLGQLLSRGPNRIRGPSRHPSKQDSDNALCECGSALLPAGDRIPPSKEEKQTPLEELPYALGDLLFGRSAIAEACWVSLSLL